MNVKNAIILLLCIVSFALKANSQTIKRIVKTSAVNFLNDKFGIAYEQKINGKSSWLVEPVYQFKSTETETEFNLLRTWQINAEYRRYIGSLLYDAPKKTYVGFSLGLDYQNVQSNFLESNLLVNDSFINNTVGLVAGYQLIISDQFVFDFFINPAFKFQKILELDIYDDDIQFLIERIGVSIGFCFK